MATALKPRIGVSIVTVLVGALLVWGAVVVDIPIVGVVLGAIGALLVAIGLFAVANRGRNVIAIDATGIEIPASAYVPMGSDLASNLAAVARVFGGKPRVLIATPDIRAVGSLRGRLVEVALKDGTTIHIQALAYCGLGDFLAACKAHGLPVRA